MELEGRVEVDGGGGGGRCFERLQKAMEGFRWGGWDRIRVVMERQGFWNTRGESVAKVSVMEGVLRVVAGD